MYISYFALDAGILLCLIIRTGYELLKEARKVNPENKLVFAIVFSAMCALWICWFSLCPLDPFAVSLPDVVRWTAFAFFVIGVVVAVGALAQLRGLENIDHLVTTGWFLKLRHPMYTGFILWVLSWSVYHGAIFSLVPGMLIIVNVLYWRRLEETRLLARYGEIYRQYRLTTWF